MVFLVCSWLTAHTCTHAFGSSLPIGSPLTGSQWSNVNGAKHAPHAPPAAIGSLPQPLRRCSTALSCSGRPWSSRAQNHSQKRACSLVHFHGSPLDELRSQYPLHPRNCQPSVTCGRIQPCSSRRHVGPMSIGLVFHCGAVSSASMSRYQSEISRISLSRLGMNAAVFRLLRSLAISRRLSPICCRAIAC